MPSKISCSKKRKANCSSPCTWIRANGCKSTLKPIKQKKHGSRGGCSGIKKTDCKEPCIWIKNKGCSKSKSPKSKSPKSRSPKSSSPKSRSSKSRSSKSSSPKSSSRFSLSQPAPAKNSPRYEQWKKWFVAPLFADERPRDPIEREKFNTQYLKASFWVYENDPELEQKLDEKQQKDEKHRQSLIPSSSRVGTVVKSVFEENKVAYTDSLIKKIAREIFETIEEMTIFKINDIGNVEKFIRNYCEAFIKKGKITKITRDIAEDLGMYFNEYLIHNGDPKVIRISIDSSVESN